ncbi:hypothetical protein [Streptomyces sp. NPDC050355]|uniref:hypothetical protein n=1 Tax=Streptomyces sp. NPDC050355 TaxID=3365609 RepID=UPI0037956D7F
MNRTTRNVRSSGRGWRAKVATVGSVAVAVALGLSVTPAQADGGGGGWISHDPLPPVPQGPDWSTPEAVARFLSDCGDSCTFTPTEWVGPPNEGTPTMLGTARDNCTTENADFNYGESETTGETTIVGLSLGANPVSLLPKFEHNWFKSNTESTVTTGTLKPGEIGWFDEVTVTRKAKGNWHLAGVDQSNPFAPVNAHNTWGPHDFNDVESDISYKVIRVQSRPMTEEEKVSRCGNASPS